MDLYLYADSIGRRRLCSIVGFIERFSHWMNPTTISECRDMRESEIEGIMCNGIMLDR